MVNLPISDYVKNYYREHNIVLDDFTQATIIWISCLDWYEQIAKLQELAGTTTDEALKLQIQDRVSYELQVQADFMENSDRKYIYKVTENDDDAYPSYFSTVDRALAYGKVNCETTIRIEKIILDSEDIHDVVSDCCWDKNSSNILHLHAYTYNNYLEDLHGKKIRFEEAFIHCEFPFERGDIVRDVVDGQVGVLETPRAEWERFNRRVGSGELYADSSDNTVVMAYVGDDGTSYYDHINIFNLEKVTEFKSEAEENLLKSMSKMLRGEEMLWMYHYYLKQYVMSK